MRNLLWTFLLMAVSGSSLDAQPFLTRYENLYTMIHAGRDATLPGAAMTEGQAARHDGLGHIYVWDETSVAPTNADKSVIAVPGLDVGRWFTLAPISGGGAGGTFNPTSGYVPWNNGGSWGDSRIHLNGTDWMFESQGSVYIRPTNGFDVLIGDSDQRSVRGTIGHLIPKTANAFDIGSAALPVADVFARTAYYAEGSTDDGVNFSRLSIAHTGPAGANIFDSQSAGTAGNPRPFEFSFNGSQAGFIEYDLFAGSVAFGYGSSYGLAGSANTAYGALTLNSLTTGANNTAIGEGALASITSPSADTALGQFAGHAITTGDNNVLIGRDAAAFSIGGASLQSTIIGALAGNSVGTRTNVIVLGYNASAATTANSATIGNSSVSSIWLGGNVAWYVGTGTPEGSISAPVGSFFSRLDGGAGTSFYVKEPGTGNTGWIAK